VALAVFVGVPLAIFLLWRLLLWIGQGFWQQPAAETEENVSTALYFNDAFWTVRTMALTGPILFVAFGAVAGVGGMLPNAAIGAILGAVMARFLPR
jgi:hypothetical protein